MLIVFDISCSIGSVASSVSLWSPRLNAVDFCVIFEFALFDCDYLAELFFPRLCFGSFFRASKLRDCIVGRLGLTPFKVIVTREGGKIGKGYGCTLVSVGYGLDSRMRTVVLGVRDTGYFKWSEIAEASVESASLRVYVRVAALSLLDPLSTVNLNLRMHIPYCPSDQKKCG